MNSSVAKSSSTNPLSRVWQDWLVSLLNWGVDYFPLLLLGQALALLVVERGIPQLNGIPKWIGILFLCSTVGIAVSAMYELLAKRLKDNPALPPSLTMFLVRLISSFLIAAGSIVALFFIGRIIESNSSLTLCYLASLFVHSLLSGFFLYLYWIAFVRPDMDEF